MQLPEFIDIWKILLIAILAGAALLTGWLGMHVAVHWYERFQADMILTLLKIIEDTTEKCKEEKDG